MIKIDKITLNNFKFFIDEKLFDYLGLKTLDRTIDIAKI